MTNIDQLLFAISLGCFLLSTFGVSPKGLNLTALGLALCVTTLFV